MDEGCGKPPLVVASAWKAKVACLCLGLALFVWAGRARAQQESVAESLFHEARESLKRGEPQLACPQFAESYRLDPSLGTLLNWGICEQQLGRIATAWTKLRQFVDGAPAGDPRLSLAQRKLAELELELPKLRVLVPAGESGATVYLDGVELRGASLGVNLPVDPGEHLLVIKLATGESGETRVRIAVAEQLEVALARPKRPAPADPMQRDDSRIAIGNVKPLLPKIEERRGQKPQRQPTAERHWAYGVGALGAAGLVTSGVFGLLALHERSVVRAHCPEHQCQDQVGLDATRHGARDETVANVTFIAGALATGAAALLWLHSGRSAVAVQGGANGVALAFQRAFP